ncbi:hypothetical protein BXO87_01730 [Bacillus sp. GZB]|uniref:tyrosine-type recombinase/integrase n=1 Tax=Bacillus TaxID=1386 RepID=UPI000977B006|nr:MULTISPECIES: tyrosine-type recombinase/integrase [Bacillus]MCZ4246848.1 tyrosine-type recombinase/integrase [Bacillus amyloliquefaciens]OMQ06749.1 hypothetical protein BXO87_01730 [Bacillus sp. GZB]
MRGSVKQDKKTKKWFYEVTVSTDPITGKRKRKKKRGFDTEKAAQKALIELIAEIQKNEYLEPSTVPLSTYLSEFLKIRATELEGDTFKTEKGNMETHILPELGRLPLGKVTTDRLQRFIDKLLEEKGLQASSVKRIFDPLRIALDRAVTRGYIRENPANAVIKPKITRSEMTVWSKEDVVRFLNFAKKDRMFMLFHLAFTTGLRQSELLGLRWKDLDTEQGVLRITQVLTRDGELKPRGKTASATRAVTLMEETLQLLQKHREMLARERFAAGDKYKDHGLILPSSKGTPLLHRNTNRSFDRLVKEYNALADKMKDVNNIDVPRLEKIRFHDMRHTHATLLLLARENPKIVAERLGHSKVSVTLDTYSHVLPNMQKEVPAKLAEVLNG